MQERCQRKEQELLMSRQEKNTMSNKGRTDFGIQHRAVLEDKQICIVGFRVLCNVYNNEQGSVRIFQSDKIQA